MEATAAYKTLTLPFVWIALANCKARYLEMFSLLTQADKSLNHDFFLYLVDLIRLVRELKREKIDRYKMAESNREVTHPLVKVGNVMDWLVCARLCLDEKDDRINSWVLEKEAPQELGVCKCTQVTYFCPKLWAKSKEDPLNMSPGSDVISIKTNKLSTNTYLCQGRFSFILYQQ